MKIIDTNDLQKFRSQLEKDLCNYFALKFKSIETIIEKFAIAKKEILTVYHDEVPNYKMVDDINEQKSLYLFKDNPKGELSISVISMYSIIKLPSTIGSQRSLEFIQKLASAGNKRIFSTQLINAYLQYKWRKMSTMIYFQTFLIFLNVPLIVYIEFQYEYKSKALWVFIGITAVFLIFEVLQFIFMNLYQYLGNYNLREACIGLRYISLSLLLIEESQIYFCCIYMGLSILSTTKNGLKKSIIIPLIFYCFLLSSVKIVFSTLWISYEFIKLLAIGILIFFILFITGICIKIIRTESKHLIILEIIANYLNLSFLVLFFVYPDHNSKIITFFSIGTCCIIQYFEEMKKKYDFLQILCCCLKKYLLCFCCKRFLFCSIAFVLYIFNFFNLGGEFDYFIKLATNTFLSAIFLMYTITLTKKYFDVSGRGQFSILHTSLFSAVLILTNTEENLNIKFIIIIVDLLILLYLRHKKGLSISKMLLSILDLLFSLNSLDISRLALSVAWIYKKFYPPENTEITFVFFCLILIKGMSGFRSFKITRYYIRLIMNSIIEISPFILIFFYSTLSFGIICSIYGEKSLRRIWMYPYDLNIGSAYHEDNLDMNYLTFFLATFINVIIMLNLLVSILGDSFDRFQISAAEIDYMEMAQTLVEYESMYIWNMVRKGERKYLIWNIGEVVVKERKGKLTREEFTEKIDELKEMIKNLSH